MGIQRGILKIISKYSVVYIVSFTFVHILANRLTVFALTKHPTTHIICPTQGMALILYLFITEKILLLSKKNHHKVLTGNHRQYLLAENLFDKQIFLRKEGKVRTTSQFILIVR